MYVIYIYSALLGSLKCLVGFTGSLFHTVCQLAYTLRHELYMQPSKSKKSTYSTMLQATS
jgi:hypothetical protein